MDYLIPNGWEEKKLGDILVKSSSKIAANQIKTNTGDYPVYGASGFLKKIDFYDQESEYLAIIKDGSGVGRVEHYEGKTSILSTMEYLHPKNVNIRFVYYLLKSIDFKKYYAGAAIPHIYFKDYSNEKILVPSISEQQRIVEKLDKIFAELDKEKAIAEQNLSNAKELFDQIVDEYLQKIASSLDVKTVKELCDIERGSSPRPIKKYITESSDGINWIKIGDCVQKFVEKTNQKITLEGAKKSRKVFKGDLIISNSMSYGKPYILNIDGCIHDGWFVLHYKKEILNREYLYYVLSSLYAKKQYDYLASGAIVKNISSDLIKQVKIPLPKLSEQQHIVEKLDYLQSQTQELEKIYTRKLCLIEELKQSVLHKAFQGEL